VANASQLLYPRINSLHAFDVICYSDVLLWCAFEDVLPSNQVSSEVIKT
jgi:hypothetical protein